MPVPRNSRLLCGHIGLMTNATYALSLASFGVLRLLFPNNTRWHQRACSYAENEASTEAFLHCSLQNGLLGQSVCRRRDALGSWGVLKLKGTLAINSLSVAGGRQTLAEALSIIAMQPSSGNLLRQWGAGDKCAPAVWEGGGSDYTDSELSTWVLGNHAQFLGLEEY